MYNINDYTITIKENCNLEVKKGDFLIENSAHVNNKDFFLLWTFQIALISYLQKLKEKGFKIKQTTLPLTEIIEKAGFDEIKNFEEYIESAYISQNGEPLFKQGAIFYDLIKKLDLEEFFESPKPINRVITNNLFTLRNLEPSPSSIIAEILFNHCISEDYFNYKNLGEYNIKIKTGDGDIEFILGAIKEPIKEQLIEIIGIDTYKVLEILLTQCLNKIKHLDEKITLSGWDIIKLLNKENVRDKTGNSRISKEYTLDWLATHINIISRYKIYIGRYAPKGKKTFNVRETNIVNVLAVDRVFPLDENGSYDRSKPLLDYHVEFSIGLWMHYFNDQNGEYLNQFGYNHKEAFAINTRNKWAEKIYFWAKTKIEQSRNNPERGFKVRTIIEGIGEKTTLENILTEPVSSKRGILASNFKRDFELALDSAFNFKVDSYSWKYKDAPEWVFNDKERKPRGWFDSMWLELVIIIDKPTALTASKTIDVKAKKVKEPSLTVEDLKNAINENKITLRPLAEMYGVSFSWLQRRIKSGKFTQTELKDLITQTKLLGKKTKQ